MTPVRFSDLKIGVHDLSPRAALANSDARQRREASCRLAADEPVSGLQGIRQPLRRRVDDAQLLKRRHDDPVDVHLGRR
jgi:hypothetical protein